MTPKTKMMLVGALLTAGTLGTVTAFADTSTSTTTTTASTTTSQSSTLASHHGYAHGGFAPGGAGGRGGFRFDNLNEAATILGIDQQTLQSDLKAGQSLVQIAQTKNIDEQTLITDLQNNLKTKLDAQVSSGKLTADKETQMLNNFSSNAMKMVENTGDFGHGGFSGHHGKQSGQTTSSTTNSITSSSTGN